nr:hypothetical protein [Tanacetum cinerariifolium]
MSTPTFAKTHNLIAYLEKPTESEGFAQIIDFLNGSSVNSDSTLVDGKRVNIKESSIRRTPRLDDTEGASCLSNTEIFEGLARMRNVTPLFANVLKNHKPRRKHTQEPKVPLAKSPTEYNLPSPSYEQKLPSHSHDLLPSGEDSLKLKELIDLCTNLSNKVIDLEKKEESSKQGRNITDIDADIEINLEKAQANLYNLDLDHPEKVLSIHDDEEPTGVEEKKRGVVIQDPKETTTTASMQLMVQAKDKEKAILIEEPKPLKRQAQIELDEAVARQMEAELNVDIN